MKPEFNIQNCTFNDHAAFIQTYNDNTTINISINDIESARRATTDEKIIKALDQLLEAVKENNKSSVSKVVKDFAIQFSSSLFASIASVPLLEFVRSFLK